MAVKTFKHHKHGFEVRVEAKKGKVFVNNKGMVKLNIPYKKCEMIDEEIFREKFVEA